MTDILGHEVKMGDFVLLLPNYRHRYVNECSFGLLISEKKVFMLRYNKLGTIEKSDDYLLQFPDTDIKRKIYDNLCYAYSEYCINCAKELGNYIDVSFGDSLKLRNKESEFIYLGRLNINIYRKDGTGVNYEINADIVANKKHLIEDNYLVDNVLYFNKLMYKFVYARALYDVVKNKSWKKKAPKLSCLNENSLHIESMINYGYDIKGLELLNSTSIIDVSMFRNPDVNGEYVLSINLLDKNNITLD